MAAIFEMEIIINPEAINWRNESYSINGVCVCQSVYISSSVKKKKL